MPVTTLRLDVTVEVATALAVQSLGGTPDDDGTIRCALPELDLGGYAVLARITSVDGGSVVTLAAEDPPRIPYFGWFTDLTFGMRARRTTGYAVRRLEAAVAGMAPPDPPRSLPLTPPAAFSPEQGVLLATVCAITAMAEMGSALFSQFVDFIGISFHASDRALGVSLATSRAGVLIALVATALADRLGRRRMLLLSAAGICAGNLISLVAPSLAVFTAGQIIVRGFVNSAFLVGTIIAIEQAPEGARAYSIAMLTLAGGFGYAFGLVLLPVADLAKEAWRAGFLVSVLSVLLLPGMAGHLRETTRFSAVAGRTDTRSRMREVVDRTYGRRFLVLVFAGFLLNVFQAPTSQLTNRYLARVRHFSGARVALLTAITGGPPGLLGLVLGGRLAETRGRRPIGAFAVFVATALTMGFFVFGGALLWLMASTGSVFSAMAAPAVAAFSAELFPTEVRGTANGLLIVSGLAGSATGLVVAGSLAGSIGLGHAIAWLGIGPLIAAVALIPRLPEAAARRLDDVSPSEVAPPDER